MFPNNVWETFSQKFLKEALCAITKCAYKLLKLVRWLAKKCYKNDVKQKYIRMQANGMERGISEWKKLVKQLNIF